MCLCSAWWQRQSGRNWGVPVYPGVCQWPDNVGLHGVCESAAGDALEWNATDNESAGCISTTGYVHLPSATPSLPPTYLCLIYIGFLSNVKLISNLQLYINSSYILSLKNLMFLLIKVLSPSKGCNVEAIKLFYVFGHWQCPENMN